MVAKGEIAVGKNPQKAKRAIRDVMTFFALFTEYMEKYSKVHKKSWIYDEREVNKFLKHWFKRKISSITKSEVERLHAKIGKENGIAASAEWRWLAKGCRQNFAKVANCT